jgi:hypothetical protein
MKTLMGFVLGVIVGGASFAGAIDWDQQWNPQFQQLRHQQEVEAQKQQLERWEQEQHRRRPC